MHSLILSPAIDALPVILACLVSDACVPSVGPTPLSVCHAILPDAVIPLGDDHGYTYTVILYI